MVYKRTRLAGGIPRFINLLLERKEKGKTKTGLMRKRVRLRFLKFTDHTKYLVALQYLRELFILNTTM